MRKTRADKAIMIRTGSARSRTQATESAPLDTRPANHQQRDAVDDRADGQRQTRPALPPARRAEGVLERRRPAHEGMRRRAEERHDDRQHPEPTRRPGQRHPAPLRGGRGLAGEQADVGQRRAVAGDELVAFEVPGGKVRLGIRLGVCVALAFGQRGPGWFVRIRAAHASIIEARAASRRSAGRRAPADGQTRRRRGAAAGCARSGGRFWPR